jgi:hypothetical protein
MIGAAAQYISSLVDRFGRQWNRFWYTPTDVYTLCVMRLLTGLASLVYHLSYGPDFVRWFGAGGLLPRQSVRFVTGSGTDGQWNYGFSIFQWTDSPALLWVLYGAGMVILLMFTVGWWTRISSVLSLIVLLSFVHRAPMIASQAEPVLTMLVAYLCLAPTGSYLSLDRWQRARKRHRVSLVAEAEPLKSTAATVSLRLIQVHTAAFYLMAGLTKLAGTAWWSGEAIWFLMAQSESRLVDLTFLREHVYLINAWTHGVVLFDLLFGVLIWNQTARPLLLAISLVVWLSLGMITGLMFFCLLMLIANVSFVSPELLRSIGSMAPASRSAGVAGAER